MENDVLAVVYRTYSREIYLYLYGLSHNRQLSEDLMQETFAKALITVVTADTGIRAWLYKVARNLYFNTYRKDKRLIIGLENAEFVRYGVMHRNSYMDSPNLLKQTFQSKSNPNLFFAGQMTGVEGYVESAASGLVAGINAARLFKGEEEVIFPHTTAIGSLPYYVTHAESKHFQPMNVNFGIIKELEGPRIRDKKERYEKIAERALKDLQPFIQA